MIERAIAEIDLAAIQNNILFIKDRVGPNKKILQAVKADAYGHGIIEVSKMIEKKKLVDMLGIATIDEGIQLRESGIKLPILLLGLIVPGK
jgi:alanine racemase